MTDECDGSEANCGFPAEKIWFTRSEAAAYLGISDRLVDRLAHAKQIRGFRHTSRGGKRGFWRFRREDLDAYLESIANCSRPREARPQRGLRDRIIG